MRNLLEAIERLDEARSAQGEVARHIKTIDDCVKRIERQREKTGKSMIDFAEEIAETREAVDKMAVEVDDLLVKHGAEDSRLLAGVQEMERVVGSLKRWEEKVEKEAMNLTTPWGDAGLGNTLVQNLTGLTKGLRRLVANHVFSKRG